jgi:hypothetical protein
MSEVPNYAAMSDGDVLQALGDNGQKWAQAFMQTIGRIGRDKIDEGLMVVWFANAIEHSNDVRRWQREAAAKQAAGSGACKSEAFIDEGTLTRMRNAERDHPATAHTNPGGWCKCCGCGNDVLRYRHLPSCRRPTEGPVSTVPTRGHPTP